MSRPVQGVHFVGSWPKKGFSDTTSVFKKSVELCPGRLFSIPDGELGERNDYIWWQIAQLPKTVLKMSNPDSDIKLDPSYTPSLDDIASVNYDKYAIESYHEFRKAKDSGLIPPGIRFQVSIPHPQEVLIAVHQAYQPEVAPLFERRLFDMVDRLIDAIPEQDLAIQWDLAAAVVFIEMSRGETMEYKYGFKHWQKDPFKTLMDVTGKCVEYVKSKGNIPVGVHICYGDHEHKHFMEPKDLGLPVEMVNSLFSHNIQWVHMPVPKSRADAAYFAPLKTLHMPDSARLFLGLIHPNDLEGAQKRIATALEAYPKGFGVGTECGMGRTPPEEIDSILNISRDVSSPL